MASQMTAAQTEIPTTERLSEYRKEEKRGIVAIAGIGRENGLIRGKVGEFLWSWIWI